VKIVCNTKELLGAVSLVGRAVPTRTTMPIYQHIKLVVTDGVVLMGTDLECGIRYTMNGDTAVKERGESVVDPSRLAEILRETGDDVVTIEADKKGVYVTTTMGEFTMPTDDPSGFQDVVQFDDSKGYIEMRAATFHSLARRTLFAAAKDEGKYAMQGVLFDAHGGLFKAVATDGKRLAVANGPSINEATGDALGTAIVPSKAFGLVDQVASNDADDAVVRVTWDKSTVWFQTTKATVTSRLVEGRFPSWRDVIPKKFAVTLNIDGGSFSSAVRQAAIMADDESKRVVMEFDSGKVKMKAQGATTGKSHVTLNLDYVHDALSIAFDPDYLKDAFKALGNNVTMSMVDPNRPAVFKDGDDYLHMIVPMV